MPALAVAAAFEDIGKADQVGVDIGGGIDRRMRDTGLSRKVNDICKAPIFEQACNGAPIGKIAFLEMKIRTFLQFVETSLFQPGIVIIVQIVESMDGPAVREKPARQVKADEAGRASDKNGFAHS